MDKRMYDGGMTARGVFRDVATTAVFGGVNLAVEGIGNLIGRRKDRKAYEKQVAATDEAVQEQQKRELAAATNQKKAMARARGIELMYKTGMFDAPKWQS